MTIGDRQKADNATYGGMADEAEIRRKYEALEGVMDDRLRRLWAEVEAECSVGGIAAVERATGLSRTTIRVGRDELRKGVEVADVVESFRQTRVKSADPNTRAWPNWARRARHGTLE